MWTSVVPDEVRGAAPSARSKHSATLLGEHVYVLGGRNGNLPLKDFWKYNLVSGNWQQLKPSGDLLPCLQEHTAVAYKDNIFVFGGEVSFSSSTETPLWVYDVRDNSWRKVKTKKGVATPKGRRGHTALVHNGAMLIYGGYQDLRGSCGELWAFHFDTESWHLVSAAPSKPSDQFPSPRHKHSAVVHGEAMWIYGGMNDLHSRGDLWKWDFYTKFWTNIKTKLNPGPLHSHACCKLPSSMIIFGGERNGQSSNDLWKFNFDVESWEKISIAGLKPRPRSESRAFIVSELLLKGASKMSLEAKSVRIRARTCTSADRGNRHSSYLPNNRVAPCEKTYIFEPTQVNYNDGSNLAQQYSEPHRSSKGSFLQEISKLSQINLSRINSKCNYTILSKGNTTDSTESLLRQRTSPQQDINTCLIDSDVSSTPSRGTMVKSKSAYVIKKKYADSSTSSDEEVKETTRKKRVEFDSIVKKIPRDPISVPNFSVLNLTTPVLTPVEASKLVYLTDEETDIELKVANHHSITEVQPAEEFDDCENIQLQPLKRGDSYSSHLGYADNPLYHETIKEKSQENVSSTSDYCSIETVNRLSSASSYSVKTNTPQEETLKTKDNIDGMFGFCNPNYLSSTVKSLLTNEEKISVSKMLERNQPEQQDSEGEVLELSSFNGPLDRNTKVVYRHSCRSIRPWNLPLNKNLKGNSCEGRAQSASRAERKQVEIKPAMKEIERVDPFLPLYVYVVGGKEQGHVTVFQRPISIWRLKLF
ncbi:tip elongation aberrant protein 1 isoform X2 [Dendroctonus ponderosae]|uniref:tip elongation aberrant protein 1 isoform X2 n=1 Tax=Dendroctonus ponderosae TaxID=77166 RepID=UPI002034E680|nr:tip elongation aberrant protein 1 isoform X2 [Dendroctonus ponderosae]